jgi:hypothetical protein
VILRLSELGDSLPVKRLRYPAHRPLEKVEKSIDRIPGSGTIGGEK